MCSNATVHVIDDDAAMRDSLLFLLKASGFDVRTHDSAAAFLRDFSDGWQGCIVTDVRMPEIDGLELLRRLRTRKVDLPVIVITGHGDVAMAVDAMKAGAVDFLEKPFDDEALVTAIQAALATRQGNSRRDAERQEICQRIALLSNRERQVLYKLVLGNPNKVIAYDLGISPRTVEIYRAHVMTKMQANSLSALVRMALVAELQPPPSDEDAATN